MKTVYTAKDGNVSVIWTILHRFLASQAKVVLTICNDLAPIDGETYLTTIFFHKTN